MNQIMEKNSLNDDLMGGSVLVEKLHHSRAKLEK